MTIRAAVTRSIALHGIDGTPITISAQIVPTPSDALPASQIHPVERETRERIRAALRNSGLPWPTEPVLLTTSHPLRDGTTLADLAMACAVLAAADELPAPEVTHTVLLGELGLDGQLRPVRGVLPALLAARRAGLDRAVVPTSSLPEATLLPGVRVVGADRLATAVAGLRGQLSDSAQAASATASAIADPAGSAVDVAHRTSPGGRAAMADSNASDALDVSGPPEAVRAVEVAAAGGHYLLLVGRPGAGCRRYATLLHQLRPALTDEEALEVAAVQSVAGCLGPDTSLALTAPFIAPHHSMSMPALVGGGSGVTRPGAMTQAHRGVLFLNDVSEFRSDRLEAVRCAVDDGEVRLARRDGVFRYPARFQLVLATAPCPCGQPEQDCSCSPHARRRFLARITGPLLDRVDLRVRLRPPDDSAPGTSAPEVGSNLRTRVSAARTRAAQRWAEHRGSTNADVPATTFTHAEFRLPRLTTAPLDQALENGAMSGRGWVRALRVAWTLADLAGLVRPGRDEITEALEFRDRGPS